MSQDLRTLELFAEANPVPDEETIETTGTEAAAYLATLQRRSSEVVQLDEHRKESDRARWNWPTVLAVALIAAVLGVVLVLSTRSAPEAPPKITQPQSTSLLPDGIDGFWRSAAAEVTFDHSTLTYVYVVDGMPVDRGSYLIEFRADEGASGEWWVFMESDGVDSCQPGDLAVAQATMPTVDQMNLRLKTDECGPRLDLNDLALERVAPFDAPGS